MKLLKNALNGKVFKNIIQSKVLLYFLCIVSLVNVLFFGYIKDFQSVFTFLIVGLLMSFFSNNMIVILLAAIVLTNVIKFSLKIQPNNEGMDNMKKKKKVKENMETEEEEEEDSVVVSGDDKKQLDKFLEDAENLEKEVEESSDDLDQQQKMEMYKELKKDMIEFEGLQKSIMNNMKEIDPLLTRAENFVEKFEGYKAKLN
tara:strand:+ start:49 stop:651 length:603 start_codon:yes stop_codon:yes gene_type:complete